MAANLGKTFRVNNSGGKTLLENWVEEVSCSGLDKFLDHEFKVLNFKSQFDFN